MEQAYAARRLVECHCWHVCNMVRHRRSFCALSEVDSPILHDVGRDASLSWTFNVAREDIEEPL